jgi:hypothetical protein
MINKEELNKEVERLKEIINTLSKEETTMILRGERPLRIEYNDFKVLRKSIQDQTKKYLKGKINSK